VACSSAVLLASFIHVKFFSGHLLISPVFADSQRVSRHALPYPRRSKISRRRFK